MDCSEDTAATSLPVKPLPFSFHFSETHVAGDSASDQVSVCLSTDLDSSVVPMIDDLDGLDRDGYFHDGSTWHFFDAPSPNSDTEGFRDPPEERPISFLPLPATFDYRSPEHWTTLSKDIEDWLLAVPDHSQQWTWGRDAFWLAFLAAYPQFPHGSWRPWDTHISVQGTFVEEWLSSSAGSDMDASHVDAVRRELWDEFVRHVGLFHPLPIIAPA